MTDAPAHPWRNALASLAVAAAAIGVGWALFQKLEAYDVALIEVRDAVSDLDALERERHNALANRASSAALQRSQIADQLRQVHEATLDVGADMQHSLGFHEGQHHSGSGP